MSTLSVSNITDGTDTVGTSYVVNGSAKAWVNLNGEGTIAIRNSFNTSSITDINTGNYAQDFTSNFDAGDNYASHSTADDESWGNKTTIHYQTVSQARMQTFQGSASTNSGVDTYRAIMTHHGDLA